MSRKQITLADIAAACGTSNVTVSKALSGKSGMSDELREKIIATANEMGYVPSKAASAAMGGTIGIIVPEKFTNPNGSFYLALYNHLMQGFKRENYSCIQEILTLSEEEALEMPAFLRTNTVMGVISLGQLSPKYLTKLIEVGKPLLLLDYYVRDIDTDCIITNGYFGMYKLTCHLISQGHKRIGFVGTPKATSSIADRYMGYLKALMEFGLPIEKNWVVEDRRPNNDLYEELVYPVDMPTAFVCNCDEAAFKVIKQLKELGYSVPEDISVVGYDNYNISEICDPPITTINVDAREMAELAVATVVERINNPKAPTRMQILDGKPVYKASVKKLC